PVQNIDDVIRFIPGIEVQQRGPQGSQSDIVIRGGTFQQVLVVLDGVRINDPLTGHFNAYIPIHPEEIERIEILKGSAAAIHGPDAVGGVVNIITKTFADKIQSNKIIAGASFGSYQMLNGNLYGTWKKGNTTISVGITSNNAKGPELRGATGYFHNKNGVVSLHHQINKKWKFSVRGAMDERDFNAQNFYTTFLSDTAKEKVKSNWIQAQLVGVKGRTTKTLQVVYKNLSDQYQYRPGASANKNQTDQLFIQAYRTVKLNKGVVLTWGEQAIYKKIVSNDRGNHDHVHAGFYGILSNKLGKRIHMNETFRVDWDQNYGWIFVPQFNLSWAPYIKNVSNPSLLNFRAGIGRGIRDADFTERYNNYNKSLVTGGSIGNPDLIAERSWNYEVGVDVRPAKNIKISGTAFTRNQSDLIDWVPTKYELMPRKVNLVTTGNYALASNLASVITKGVELDIEMGFKLGDQSNIKFMTGLLWLKSKANDEKPLSFYLSSHARFLWNGNALLTLGKTSLSVGFVHKTRQAQSASAINASVTPSYFICNGRIYQTLNRSGSKVFIQADNTFNVKYSDLLGSVMPGRWLSMGVQWVFEKNR
ncbi:MAG: TonB-dependent receptor plug domain-containing protein, partial [Chitinophagaceae bacterium]